MAYATDPSSRQPRGRRIAGWVLAVALGAMFLLSGWSKLSNGETAGGMRFDEQFVAWGYPAWFRFVVGAAEVLGAMALFAPALRFYGATLLTGLMAGGVVTHLANAEAVVAPIPFVLGAFTATLAWIARPAWVQRRLATIVPQARRTA